MNVIEMVKMHLVNYKFDGLFNPDIECGCSVDDIEPCDCISSSCEAAYEFRCSDCICACTKRLEGYNAIYSPNHDFCKPVYLRENEACQSTANFAAEETLQPVIKRPNERCFLQLGA